MYCRTGSICDAMTVDAEKPSCQPNDEMVGFDSWIHFEEPALMDGRTYEIEILGGMIAKMWRWSAVPFISMQVPSMLRMDKE